MCWCVMRWPILSLLNLNNSEKCRGPSRPSPPSLMKVWDADLDLQALAARSPRISDLARIEAYVRDHLPGGMMLQRELVSAAIANLKNAGCVLGSVTVRGIRLRGTLLAEAVSRFGREHIDRVAFD